jgi:putative Mn2+ efflux pump MntP
MSQYFSHYSDVWMSLIGFGLFAFVFIGWVIVTGLPGNKKTYESIAKNILNDGENP